MKLTSIAKVDVIPNISSTSQNTNASIGASLATLMSTPAATTFADSTSMSDLFGSLTKGPATVDVWTGSVSCVLSVECRSIGGRSTPCLTGGIFTDNSELVTMDMINSRLVVFDDNYCYKREYKVDGMATDITRGVNTDEILIGLPEGVMRCTLQDDQLTVFKTINCSANVYGIAVFGDNILVSTDRSVEIMSPEGIIQKSIKMNIGFLTRIVASPSTSTLYYNDGDDVVCRQLDSDVEVYSNRGLRNSKGIGLDRDSNVYVFGYNSGNVYLVSSDGSRGKELDTSWSSIRRPYGIIVHPTKQEIIVTSYRESTSLEVYRFCDNT